MRRINNLIFASIILILVAGCSVKFSYAVLTRTPRVIFEFQYEDARDFHDGMAAVKLNGRWGYINNLGQTVIPFNNRIPEPGNFADGLAFLGDRFVNYDGDPAFVNDDNPDVKYFSGGREFSQGVAAVQYGGQWGYIDLLGNFIIAPTYQNARSFSEGLAAVMNNKGLWGYIDFMGNLKIPYKYIQAGDFREGLARIKINGRWGYINQSDKIIIAPAYYEAGDFGNGLAPVRGRNNYHGWGYINKSGKMIIRRRFNYAGNFSEGLAPVAGDSRYGYINVRGEWEFSPFYDDVRSFSEGFAAVRQENKWGYISQ